jgi:ribose 5-phosphate isomerase B
MRIALASDHAGFGLKDRLVAKLAADGHDTVDLGTESEESVDYPRYAEPAARMVAAGEADTAVLVCGSGNGVAIVANKVAGIRAVNAHDAHEAEMARRHNDANVVTLSGARLDERQAGEIVDAFLTSDFEGGRHERRVNQISALERGATETTA